MIWRLRTACALTILLLLALVLPFGLQAQYTFMTNNGALTITKYTGSGGAVIIPGTTNGLPVTGIGAGAFQNLTNVTSVTIPDSLTSIGISAFDCCTSLTGVTFGNSVTNIDTYAFTGCTGLTNVTIPNSVITIGFAAFSGCASLSSLTIGTGVASIGSGAFGSCGLTNVSIGAGVTNIGSEAFVACDRLVSITVDQLNIAYSSLDGVLLNKSQTALIQCPGGKPGRYTVPNSVTTIGEGAFEFCSSLISVTLSNNVTSIGDEAFFSASLITIVIGSGVTNIGSQAFYQCNSLKSILVSELNSTYSSLDGVLFNKTGAILIQCPGGKFGSYTVPNSVATIGDEAFAFCLRLIDVTISESVTSIGDHAFVNCTGLTDVLIPNSVANIGNFAFAGCRNVTNISIGTSVMSIGDYAFEYCTSMTNFAIPDSVGSIGEGAFTFCTSLASASFGNGLFHLGNSAFAFCINLRNVVFRGNAPGYSSRVFDYESVLVYYMPGMAGWQPTFDDRPAVLWDPRIDTSGASFGVRTNGFGFTIRGTDNPLLTVVVEACTNLAHPAWFAVGTNTLTYGSSEFRDPKWTNSSSRLYRLRSP